ncbi:MAG: hypothetical protein QOH27_5161 [Mycobacterium sp.]|jgi:hypothetical protein|nr:hypothetical protein [Mycobacterium sp.]MDT7759263.1 hypothetical protein [Mycobacterium sp.]
MDFAAFRLSDDERMKLLAVQTECTVGWLNSDGWPVSAFLTYARCVLGDVLPRPSPGGLSSRGPPKHGRSVQRR